LRLLDRVATRCNWRVFAWVLMSNHILCGASHKK
jgi:REP element-mobilizing transposase RayT